MDREFKAGDIVIHFKHEEVENFAGLDDFVNMNVFKYKIIYIGDILDVNTDMKKKSVIYKALYGEGMAFQRDYDEFMSEVDHDKYPLIKQQYRFEKVEKNEK